MRGGVQGMVDVKPPATVAAEGVAAKANVIIKGVNGEETPCGNGERLQILDTVEQTRLKVKSCANNKEGWVNIEDVKIIEVILREDILRFYQVVRELGVPVTEGPKRDSKKLRTLDNDTILAAVERTNDDGRERAKITHIYDSSCAEMKKMDPAGWISTKLLQSNGIEFAIEAPYAQQPGVISRLSASPDAQIKVPIDTTLEILQERGGYTQVRNAEEEDSGKVYWIPVQNVIGSSLLRRALKRMELDHVQEAASRVLNGVELRVLTGVELDRIKGLAREELIHHIRTAETQAGTCSVVGCQYFRWDDKYCAYCADVFQDDEAAAYKDETKTAGFFLKIGAASYLRGRGLSQLEIYKEFQRYLTMPDVGPLRANVVASYPPLELAFDESVDFVEVTPREEVAFEIPRDLFKINAFGVLGYNNGSANKSASVPAGTAVVNQLFGGAEKFNCRWFDGTDSTAEAHIMPEGSVKCMTNNGKTMIHIKVPDLKRDASQDDTLQEDKENYYKVLKEFAKTDCTVLRVPPIRGARMRQLWETRMQNLVVTSLAHACERAFREFPDRLRGKEVHLCCFMNGEVRFFREEQELWKACAVSIAGAASPAKVPPP